MDNKPKPLYKIGDHVEFESGKLGIIDENPIWRITREAKPQWYYSYNYGLFGNEGNVLECHIKKKLN